MLTMRDYVPDDQEACLAVFDSNVPDYFGANERAFFESYLANLRANLRGPYFVIEDGQNILACGGMALHKPEVGTAELAWGMVIRSRHRNGLGRLLLVERLKRLNADPSLRVGLVNTSQFTAGFFTKMGFMTRQVTPDGFFPGMDKYEMSVPLPFHP
jgi:hypothetical protein